MKKETMQGIVEEWHETNPLSSYGSVIAVWNKSWRVPRTICQLAWEEAGMLTYDMLIIGLLRSMRRTDGR